MTSLDELLQKFVGHPMQVFDVKGNFTDDGYAAYQRFCELLFDTESIVGEHLINADKVQQQLDEIASSNI